MRAMTSRDPYVGRYVGVSALAHGALLFVLLVVLPFIRPASPPIVAYTVELTDSSALGGRQAPGRPDLPPGPRPGPAASEEAPAKLGEPVAKSEPVPPPTLPPAPIEQAKPVEPAKPPEPPKPEEPAVKLPSPEKPPPPKPEARKPPEPKPEPKPQPEAKKPEPPKPETKPEPKPVEAKPEAKAPQPPKASEATAKPPPKTAEPTPAEARPAGKPNGKPDGTADGGDSYAAAANRWRAKGATGGGGGLAGTDTGSGPLGTGYGAGGGQVVGFEFLAYQQRVVSMVKSVWTNAAPRPGLVAKVRFQIAPNGDVSGIRLEQASGDGVFDGSAMRAVQRANPLPAPPAHYANDFRDFVIEFHSEEGGQAPG
jgi:colicin import membrane protein